MNENKIKSTIKAVSRFDETKWIAEMIEKIGCIRMEICDEKQL